MNSLSMLAITSKILALREAKVLSGCLQTPLSNSHYIEESKGLKSGELGGQISFEQWFFQVGLQPGWRFQLCGRAKLFAHLQRIWCSAGIFLAKDGLLHKIILEMVSFPMNVVNNFYDQPLHKYLDSKTVLIYCPHPVYSCQSNLKPPEMETVATQGAKLSFPVVPPPLTRRRVVPPPPLVPGGRAHSIAGKGVWGGPDSDDGTNTEVLYVYLYFVGKGH